MFLRLRSGDGITEFELPSESIFKVLEGKPLPVAGEEKALVEAALANPIGAAPLREMVKKGETACIIVGDMTRLWVRHHLLLPPILNELNKGGIDDKDICILFATGDHREQTPEEHRLLMGEEAYSRVRAYDHRAHRQEEMVYLGTTAYQTPVYVNRRAVEADRLILTGGIVYHFLAGWGGGKKAVIPGIASYETIMRNHSLALHREPGKGLNPLVRAGKMQNNPCSEDMLQGTEMAGPDFLVNTIIDEERHRIAGVVAGHYRTAHKQGCEYVSSHFAVTLKEQAELVIASCGGYPKDINFYQTYKTLYHANFALQKGGTMILLSESREGLGNEDFAQIFTRYRHNREREEALRQRYTIGGHMGYHTALLAEEKDILVISSLPDELVKNMGLLPVKSAAQALAFVRQKHGGIPPAYIMPQGGTTFPLWQD